MNLLQCEFVFPWRFLLYEDRDLPLSKLLWFYPYSWTSYTVEEFYWFQNDYMYNKS